MIKKVKCVMEIQVQNEETEQYFPVLDGPSELTPKSSATSFQKAINQTLNWMTHLANLLPTGTVLAFQLLSPPLTNHGKCSQNSKILSWCLVSLCALSCFLLSFTDSFVDGGGKVRYGVATWKGLWVFHREDADAVAISPEEAAKYRVRFIDLVHGLMTVAVFGAVALSDMNVVGCFYPNLSDGAAQLVSGLPLGVGFVCSFLFVAFPTKRRGIGFPVSALISRA